MGSKLWITHCPRSLKLAKRFQNFFYCLAAVNSLPKPKPYKESVPAAGSSYDKFDFKKKFSSLDFEKEPKLEFSETSAALGHTDVGPKDVAAELHAKIEEAAHHALAIIEGAKTFAEEAEKEQASRQEAIKV